MWQPMLSIEFGFSPNVDQYEAWLDSASLPSHLQPPQNKWQILHLDSIWTRILPDQPLDTWAFA